MTLNNNHKRIMGAVITLLVPLMLMFTSPNIEQEESWCPFLRLTHVPCIGCGLTKSLVCAYRGDFGASIAWHPFGLVLIIMTIALIVLSALDLYCGTNWSDRLLNHRLLWPLLGVILAICYISKLVNIFLL